MTLNKVSHQFTNFLTQNDLVIVFFKIAEYTTKQRVCCIFSQEQRMKEIIVLYEEDVRGCDINCEENY